MPDPSNPLIVKDLSHLFTKLNAKEPALNSDDNPKCEQFSNKKVFEKLEDIERLLKHIFGDSVLIDGVFKDTSVYNSPLKSDGRPLCKLSESCRCKKEPWCGIGCKDYSPTA